MITSAILHIEFSIQTPRISSLKTSSNRHQPYTQTKNTQSRKDVDFGTPSASHNHVGVQWALNMSNGRHFRISRARYGVPSIHSSSYRTMRYLFFPATFTIHHRHYMPAHSAIMNGVWREGVSPSSLRCETTRVGSCGVGENKLAVLSELSIFFMCNNVWGRFFWGTMDGSLAAARSRRRFRDDVDGDFLWVLCSK